MIVFDSVLLFLLVDAFLSFSVFSGLQKTCFTYLVFPSFKMFCFIFADILFFC